MKRDYFPVQIKRKIKIYEGIFNNNELINELIAIKALKFIKVIFS